MPSPLKTIPHASHWGAFNAIVRDGRVIDALPIANDPDPSPMLAAIPGMVHGAARVAQPMVREGWLKNRDRNRGADRFVAVSWDEALDLVAGELKRVKADHGNEAIFAGSYGWSSAGRFHHAKSQLGRFMNTIGGFTTQKYNYSFAAALALLPHVCGTAQPSDGPISSYETIIAETRQMVCFGGLSMKNTQLDSGGLARHESAGWLKKAAEAGVRFVIISPIRDDVPPFLDAMGVAEWIPIRPNTDTAMMLAMAYVLASEGLADEAFLASHCVGWPEYRAYLLGETDGQPKTPAWAEAICGVPRRPHRLPRPRQRRPAHYALCRLVAATRRPWRAAVLGAGGAGCGAGSNRLGRGRLRLRLCLRQRPGRASLAGRHANPLNPKEPDRQLYSGSAYRRHATGTRQGV